MVETPTAHIFRSFHFPSVSTDRAVTLTLTACQPHKNKLYTRVQNVRMFTKSAHQILRPIRFQSVFWYAKYVQKSKEEIQLELEAKRLNLVRTSIKSALKNKKFLSVPEWKTLTTELNTENHLRTVKNLDRVVFSALLSLRPPNDSLQNARNFIEASNISNDLLTKRIFIELYAKKASETKLTDEEEKDLIQMLVYQIIFGKHFTKIYQINIISLYHFQM